MKMIRTAPLSRIHKRGCIWPHHRNGYSHKSSSFTISPSTTLPLSFKRWRPCPAHVLDSALSSRPCILSASGQLSNPTLHHSCYSTIVSKPLHSSSDIIIKRCQSNSSNDSRQPKRTNADSPNQTDSTIDVGSNLTNLLSEDQRTLLRQVHRLSSTSRNLARQVGNVAAREDSLLADIARLRKLRKEKIKSQKLQDGTNDMNEKGTIQTPDKTFGAEIIDNSTDASTTSSTIHEKNSNNEDEPPPSLFTVVFAGEFNSGKSTLINALLGKELLESGVLPTTDAITILMGTSEEEEVANLDSLDLDYDQGTATISSAASTVSSSPSTASSPTHTQLHLLPTTQHPLLSDLCLIDTPGTNAILSLQHTTSTLRILHSADLILFITSADRPFSESERQLLQTSIKTYRKRVVLVINKMDVLERQQGEEHGERTKKRVEEYVLENAGDLLGGRPVVIPVSARDALMAKLSIGRGALGGKLEESIDVRSTSSLWKRSNFASLEHYLSQTLTASSKIKTKLLNPLGVAEGILLDCQSEVQKRREELEVDVMTLRLLTSQTEAWEKELEEEVMERCRSEVKEVWMKRAEVIERVLEELSVIDQFKMAFGGKGVFDRAWQSACRRGSSMASMSQGKKGFETAPQNEALQQNSLVDELLSLVSTYSETLSSRAKSQGDATIEYLGKRPAIIGAGTKGVNTTSGGTKGTGPSRMIGNVTVPKFNQLEKDLQRSTTTAVQTSTSNLPNDAQCAQRVYNSLQKSVVLSSLFCSSAMGPAALSFFHFLDAMQGAILSTGLLAMGSLAFPLGNKHAIQSFQNEWMSHATQLDRVLDTLFQESLRRVSMQLAESVAPYSRYVKSEGDWLAELSGKVENAMGSAHSLRSRINRACDV